LNSESKRTIFRWIFSFILIGVGLCHFIKAEFFIPLIEDLLPFPEVLVYLSGALEILLGIGLLLPKFQQVCGIFIAILFILYLPIHYRMAVSPQSFEGIPNIPWLLWSRFVFQFALIWWALWCSKRLKFGVS